MCIFLLWYGLLLGPGRSQRAQKEVTGEGTWSNTGKGYYQRVFASGFKKTRVQVYVPPESGDPDFNPTNDIAAPVNTHEQRLGNGCAVSGENEIQNNNFTEKAKDLLKKPYSEYDCSKLTNEVYPELPRTAKEQYEYLKNKGEIISSKEELREGDVIFFKDSLGNIKHVGYVESNEDGNIVMIHSSWSQQMVVETPLSDLSTQWSNGRFGEDLYFAGGGRVR